VVGGAPGCATAPQPPTNLAPTLNGTTVTLAWVSGGGCAATNYVIEAGSAPGLADLAVVNCGQRPELQCDRAAWHLLRARDRAKRIWPQRSFPSNQPRRRRDNWSDRASSYLIQQLIMTTDQQSPHDDGDVMPPLITNWRATMR
jgi:hypothetical protein